MEFDIVLRQNQQISCHLYGNDAVDLDIVLRLNTAGKLHLCGTRMWNYIFYFVRIKQTSWPLYLKNPMNPVELDIVLRQNQPGRLALVTETTMWN